MRSSGNLVDPPLRTGESHVVTSAVQKKAEPLTQPNVAPSRGGLLQALALPVAAAVTLGVHLALAHRETSVDPKPYTVFLAVVIGLSLVVAVVRSFSAGLRGWITQTGPIFAAVT